MDGLLPGGQDCAATREPRASDRSGDRPLNPGTRRRSLRLHPARRISLLHRAGEEALGICRVEGREVVRPHHDTRTCFPNERPERACGVIFPVYGNERSSSGHRRLLTARLGRHFPDGLMVTYPKWAQPLPADRHRGVKLVPGGDDFHRLEKLTATGPPRATERAAGARGLRTLTERAANARGLRTLTERAANARGLRTLTEPGGERPADGSGPTCCWRLRCRCDRL
jgi:hypothetical protein